MKTVYIYITFLVLLSCKNKADNQSNQFVAQPAKEKEETYQVETTYKYESRTSEKGNYQYNYDVSGTDDNGNEITGNIFVKGKYGTGIITNLEGAEIDVDVEWIDNGILTATDNDGNEYTLEVN